MATPIQAVQHMNQSTLKRFWAKVNQDASVPEHRPELGPCWTWKPQGSVGGYGQFYMDGKSQLAHRASYVLLVAPIPRGLTIDHLCRVRQCVRPAHLEAVTLAENVRRAKAWLHGAKFQRDKTHCPADHEYTPSNTRIGKDGKRHCRACERERVAEWRAENPLPTKPEKPARESCVNGHSAAEFGVVRKGIWSCGECDRAKLRRSRARKRGALPPLEPKPPRESCVNGHPWTEGNVYRNPNSGEEFCRECHRASCRDALSRRREFTAAREIGAGAQMTLI